MITVLLAAGLIGLGVMIALMVVSSLAVVEYNRATSGSLADQRAPVQTGLFIATAVAAIFGITAFSFLPIIGYIIGFVVAIMALTQLYRVAARQAAVSVQVINGAVLAATIVGAIGFLALAVYGGVAELPEGDDGGAPGGGGVGLFDLLRQAAERVTAAVPAAPAEVATPAP